MAFIDVWHVIRADSSADKYVPPHVEGNANFPEAGFGGLCRLRHQSGYAAAMPQDLGALAMPDEHAWLNERQAHLRY